MFASLSRKELQALAKERGLKANGKTVELIAALEEAANNEAETIPVPECSDEVC
jgi:hypothetical protein